MFVNPFLFNCTFQTDWESLIHGGQYFPRIETLIQISYKTYYTYYFDYRIVCGITAKKHNNLSNSILTIIYIAYMYNTETKHVVRLRKLKKIC